MSAYTKTITVSSGSNGSASDVQRDPSGWTNARSQASGTVSPYVHSSKVATIDYQVARYFGNFNMTTIPNRATVESAIYIHPAVSNVVNTNSFTVHLVGHTAADPVVGADFNNITLNGDTSFGSVLMSGLSTSTTTNMTINSSGLAVIQTAITTGGIAKIGVRTSLDINNTTPTGYNQYSITVTAPQLQVSYKVRGAGVLFGMI